MLPRRGVIAIVTTALGLVLLLSFRTSPMPTLARGGAGFAAVQPAANAPTPSTDPFGQGGTTQGGQGFQGFPGTGSDQAGPGGAPTPAPTPAAASKGRGTLTGQAVDTPYGTVQVQVVLSGGRITDVEAVQLPTDRRRSAMISQYAGPILRSEALSAQSARIDLVSGATYTSEGYAQSLQSALDQAHG